MALGFVTLCAFALIGLNLGASRAQSSRDEQAQQDWPSEAEKARYAEALAYCRGRDYRAIALRDDTRVLCINGWIFDSFDFRIADGLAQGGVVAVRVEGGDITTTIKLGDLIMSRRATVVVNGYCLAHCASYLFVASLKTFVPRDSLVAWTAVTDGTECAGFLETRDYGAPRYEIGPCTGPFRDKQRSRIDEVRRKFYENRTLDEFQDPPEGLTIRRLLKRKYDQTGKMPTELLWTWNPRSYGNAIKTKVFYEAYPQSQDELDALVMQLKLPWSVIYDP